MDNLCHSPAYEFWLSHCKAPFHFPMDLDTWIRSINDDVDSDGRLLFSNLITHYSRTKDGQMSGMIQYGHSAFGFDDRGEISQNIHYPIIRNLIFDDAVEGQKLLDMAMADFETEERIYAFFHYFGMSACARHGKLHESYPQVEKLLFDNGFVVEHENVYYSRVLQEDIKDNSHIKLRWKPLSNGSCREFAALDGDQEIGWGQVHFLPQEDIAYLRWIYIDGNRQHQGYGSNVMKTLFASLYADGIRRFDTDTALDNAIAQRFYEKNGFRNEGITRSYYTKQKTSG